ncbi:MAG TPA: CPBP family glutamic-type intramembrane protease, partial [Trueperaceae bacterium]
ELWSVGQVYGVLSLSLLFAGLGAVAYGVAKYDNYLAIITPVQSAEVRALFFAVLSVLLVAFALLRAHAKGWAPWEALLGGSSNFWPGIGLGLVFVALVLGVLAYAPDWPWLKGFYLDLSKLTPLMVAAVVVIPLFELFFRAFAIPALAERYSPALAVLVSATLYTLVFGSPVALLFALGLALSEIYRRRPGGLTPLVAQLTLHLGLVLAIAYSGWARALFL